jgi:hypothetical protein
LNLAKWNDKVIVHLLESSGHTFGMKHPSSETELNDHLKGVFEKWGDFVAAV